LKRRAATSKRTIAKPFKLKLLEDKDAISRDYKKFRSVCYILLEIIAPARDDRVCETYDRVSLTCAKKLEVFRA
jgi:hypothetical protein